MARRADWADSEVNSVVASGAQLVGSLMGGISTEGSRGMTVVRTILTLSIIPPVAVSDGHQRMSMGIGVISQEGFGAGVVPDANSVLDRPPRGWLWREQLVCVGAASMVSHAPAVFRADIRGKRKVDNGELVIIIDNDPIDGTAFGVRVVGMIRIVFLLP